MTSCESRGCEGLQISVVNHIWLAACKLWHCLLSSTECLFMTWTCNRGREVHCHCQTLLHRALTGWWSHFQPVISRLQRWIQLIIDYCQCYPNKLSITVSEVSTHWQYSLSFSLVTDSHGRAWFLISLHTQHNICHPSSHLTHCR